MEPAKRADSHQNVSFSTGLRSRTPMGVFSSFPNPWSQVIPSHQQESHRGRWGWRQPSRQMWTEKVLTWTGSVPSPNLSSSPFILGRQEWGAGRSEKCTLCNLTISPLWEVEWKPYPFYRSLTSTEGVALLENKTKKVYVTNEKTEMHKSSFCPSLYRQ